ncbi:MAG: MFS transporter [Clostridiales bacterium]|nr:MFS transporter [Clostridiales bacterium]
MSRKKDEYILTRIACSAASFIQSAVIMLVPLLFISIRETVGLDYGAFASLLSINFFVQLASDLVFSKVADKYGFRPFTMLSNILISIGFIGFALSPEIFENPYTGFLIFTVIFSIGGGLIEVLTSPLTDNLPASSKSGSMALLHSMYAWGQMFIILTTAVFIQFAGTSKWQYVMLAWAVPPLINFFLFAFSKMPNIPPESKSQGMREVMLTPIFILCFLIMFFGAGTENTMVQWSSAFLERVMTLPKLLGDSLGVCMFALMLGLGRLFHGVLGDKINLKKFMFFCSVLGIFCYAAVAFSSIPAVSLVACALTGLASSMLWPGTLVAASESYPKAGAWLFAILALGGDFGAAVCPKITGYFSDNAPNIGLLADIGEKYALNAEELGLRSGMAVAALYPLITAILMFFFIRATRKKKSK